MTQQHGRGALARFDAMADRAAAQVIEEYSTSFSFAARLLAPGVRRDIRNLYAMVRIADELVDGAASHAHEDPEAHLAAYEEQVLHAPFHRLHTDPVLHAYAQTYRRCGFEQRYIEAFFRSMRRDLSDAPHDKASFDEYVYGSAEVVGLLCLAVFLRGEEPAPQDRETMEAGARALGAAFQKVNFLRDLGEDAAKLGRAYFPQLAGATPEALTEALKRELVADIREDLDRAREAIPLLPTSARTGVAAAEALFRELTERIDATPAEDLTMVRVRVRNGKKVGLVAGAVVKQMRGGRA
ncbi:phytoene synthase [Corynebacterium sp. BCW_4722]|nr:phytoene synthase [Corynebacterium sp. BCW_4722]